MALQLLTIAEIAKKLNIAESTARYYRDKFEAYIPSVGEGRKKRYKPEAVEVLRLIAEGFNRKMTAEEIESQLSLAFPKTIELKEEPQQITATVQQQLDLVNVLQVIADQKKAIDELRQELKETKELIDDRDRRIMEYIRSVTQKESFLKRLFKKSR
jgi:DNA-binding transcriptional MerR regulator